MRTLTRLIAGAAVLLAMAGCTSGPEPAPSGLEFKDLPLTSANKHLLAEEGRYRFYSLVPLPEMANGRLCVVIQDEGGVESTGCGDSTPYIAWDKTEGAPGLLEAKLAYDGYDASMDLSEGWRYLHKNLLVRGLDDPKFEIAALEASAGPADTSLADDAEDLNIKADSARLLAKEDDYVFHAALSNDPGGDGIVCVVVENLKVDTASAGCGGAPRVELGAVGVKAKLVIDDYDASKELAEGWRQPHKNLLVIP